MSDAAIDWIELVTNFTCNCHCAVCATAVHNHPGELSAEQMADALASGRAHGARGVWFGGGEPTLHRALPATVRRARALSYEHVRIQSNGLRFAYPAYATAMVEAGVTEVSLLLAGADAATHEQLTGTERSFELLLAAIENLGAVKVEIDYLLTAASLADAAAAVSRFAELGVRAFTFWMTSLHGLEGRGLEPWMPRLSEAAAAMAPAFERAELAGVRATTLHTPPCVLPAEHRSRYVHAGTYNLLVVVPGGEPFRAEDSPMEGGVFPESCAGCQARPACLGARSDYVAVFGADELVPIT